MKALTTLFVVGMFLTTGAMADDVDDVGSADVGQPEAVDSAQDNEQATEAEPTVEEETPTAVEGPDAPVLVPEGPDAPDVTFELDDGSTFVLADATRPVMLVFWAEW